MQVESQRTVDRPARQKLGQLIVEILHGELAAEEFLSRFNDGLSLRDTHDPSVRLLCDDLEFLFSESGDQPIELPAETRDWLARVWLMLQTDMHLMSVRSQRWHRRQAVGLLCLVLIVVGAVASILGESVWPIMASWLAAGIVAFVYHQRHRDEPGADIEQWGHWAPFRSERQWRAYRDRYAAPHQFAQQPRSPVDPDAGGSADNRISLTSLLLGSLYGTLWIPHLLRRDLSNIHLVETDSLP